MNTLYDNSMNKMNKMAAVMTRMRWLLHSTSCRVLLLLGKEDLPKQENLDSIFKNICFKLQPFRLEDFLILSVRVIVMKVHEKYDIIFQRHHILSAFLHLSSKVKSSNTAGQQNFNFSAGAKVLLKKGTMLSF